jgi:hypothetical protein
MDAKEKIRQEIRTALRAKDEWLLISLSRKGAGAISISSDTVWHGFYDHKELRGPRWRTLASALEFSDIGYKWIVAGELSARVFKQLINNNVPRGVIMHASAVERWAPEFAKVKPALNSIRGFLNPTLPENKSRAASRPGRATRKRMKSDICALCGSTKDITLHHLIDRECGGATEEENLLSVCRSCHNDIHYGKIDIKDRVFQVWRERFKNLIEQIRLQHIE